MSPQAVIIHERQANWARQLRPRLPGAAIDWTESRSTASLVESAGRSACPIVVLDLGDRPARGLEDLDAFHRAAPVALSLVLDPRSAAEIARLARELGATLVLSGVVVPPEVEALIRRWLPLARRRSEQAGWALATAAAPEPWDRI